MELPELNDEFVKNLGVEFDSLDELKKKVTEILDRKKRLVIRPVRK